MIYNWLHDNFGWAGLLSATIAFGLAFCATVVQGSYCYYFVWYRAKYVPDYRESAYELRQARLWSLHNIVGNALLILPVQLMIVWGWSRLYLDVDAYGWPYLLVSLIGA